MYIRKIQIKINKLTDTLSSELSIIKSTVEDKYAIIQKVVIKQTDKVVDLKYQIDDVFEDFERLFTPERKSKENKKSLPYRLLYNNPSFERLTKNKLNKLRRIIDDIKANIYEGEEKQ